MKRRILVAMMFVLGFCSVQAQQGAENWEEMRAERVKKQAERKAGELELKGDAKDNFIIVFTQYQNDMFSSARKSGLFENMRGRNNEPEKKELTDAEAKEKVENYFKGQ